MFGLTEPAIAKKPITSESTAFAPAELHPVSHTLKKDWEFALQKKPEMIVDLVPFWPELAERILRDYCVVTVPVGENMSVDVLLRRDLVGLKGLRCKKPPELPRAGLFAVPGPAPPHPVQGD